MSMPDRSQHLAPGFVRVLRIACPLVLLGSFGAYLAHANGNMGGTVRSVRGADLRWLLLALLCQAAALLVIAGNYRHLLGRLGHDLSWHVLARAHLRKHAVATLVPFGSPASYVVFVRDLAPAGVSTTDAMSAVVLYSAGGQAAFVLFVAGAMGWLALSADLAVNPIAVAVALPVTLAWVTLPFLALHAGTARIARWRHMPNRARAMMDRMAAYGLTPRDLVKPMLCSLVVNAAGLGMLIASLHAVGQQPSISSLLLARLAGQLAAHALPIMQGAGAVELSLAGSLQGAGATASSATAAALLFRAAQFWLPLGLGVLFLVNVRRLLRGHQGLLTAARATRRCAGTAGAAGAARLFGLAARAARG